MAHVKGLVLLSRFEYLEHIQGPAVFREFLKKIGSEETDFLRQPVDGANLYSESLLAKVDQVLLDDHFKQKQEEFQRLGEWSARNLLDRFFNLYMEEQNPIGFLEQYARLRELLIGSGIMTIVEKAPRDILVTIDYGQNIPKSVCLSEQGFILGAMELCGAKKIKIDEEECAASQESLCCKFDIRYQT